MTGERVSEGTGVEMVGIEAPADGTMVELVSDGEGVDLPDITEYPADSVPLEPAS